MEDDGFEGSSLTPIKKKYIMPLYTCPDWNILCGPMVPHIIEAL